ncbi:M16 family metallopeptidase [Thiohalorhabdus sp. Cl-TMA]|uniref:M16 family metallopeptidase n=1 Tax=Thiohalorhabdus methylotrophus TaxID=3242694 RepID=A0ABV4TR46_9GAMM
MREETIRKDWPNGVRLAMQRKPGFAGAALGLWLVNGTRHQAPEEDGYAHLLEHILLEGPEAGQARLRAFERLGGRVNAQTGRELTTLYGTVPGDRATDLARQLAQALHSGPISRDALVRQRGVLEREREAWNSDPAAVLEDRALAAALGDDPLARPLPGESDALARATPLSLSRYWSATIHGGRVLVATVGNVDPADLEQALSPLSELPDGGPPPVTPARWHGPVAVSPSRADEFGQLSWLLPAPGAASPDRDAARLANQILGDGMDSRLDRKLRHESQLAYRFRARIETYSDLGLWWLEVDTDPQWRDTCRQVVEETVQELAEEGPTEQEVRDAVAHWHAEETLQRDDLLTQMERLALQRIYDPEGEARAPDGITAAALRDLVADAWGRRIAPPAELPARMRAPVH